MARKNSKPRCLDSGSLGKGEAETVKEHCPRTSFQPWYNHQRVSPGGPFPAGTTSKE